MYEEKEGSNRRTFQLQISNNGIILQTKAPELLGVAVDEGEVYRTFGGYLSVLRQNRRARGQTAKVT